MSSKNGTHASAQGGVLDGIDPSIYSSSSPINTLIIQVGIIIIFCRLLHFPLSKIRQPRVIAEVLGGVLLGPSVMGRVPGFTAAIFPAASMPTLSAVGNIGIILFLFLVGLEADFRFVASNWRVALSVGALGMAIPFALGAAIATGLYANFRNEPDTVPVSFALFLLFVGVAMAITAFPVLCRILTELKLLRTPVGIIVLSAGVGNDIVGWVLLALCVALVNAGNGLSALWIVLVAVAYVLLLFFAVRPAFVWLLRKTGSLQNGPSQSIVALTVLMVLASAFFTGIIGIHPIFGGFIIGLICPHEGGFAVKLTEKIEDLVSVLFLPVYFALSGLSTNLGLLNNGITWVFVICIIAVAFFGKIIGGTLAAKFNGFVWRESLTIGTLMSCKGLVELIVLNIGLQAKILSTRTFTMFVVMALLTTFATTPLVSWLYPKWYQAKLEAWKRGEIEWDTNVSFENSDASRDNSDITKAERSEVSKLIAYLRLDSLPGMLTLVSLLARPVAQKEMMHPEKLDKKEDNEPSVSPHTVRRSLRLHGVRLSAVTERDSSIMRVTELDEFADRDPVLNTVTAFSHSKSIAVSGTLLHCPEDSFTQSIVDRADDAGAELMLLPWSESGSMSDWLPEVTPSIRERFSNSGFSSFVARTAASANCPTGIFVNNNFGTRKPASRPSLRRTLSTLSEHNDCTPSLPSLKQGHHVFMPFFGSNDDRFALRLVLQLMQDPTVTATVVHFEIPTSEAAASSAETVEIDPSGTHGTHKGIGKAVATVTATESSTNYKAFFATVRDSLPEEIEKRIVFKSLPTSTPAAITIETALHEINSAPKNAGDLIVLGRNEGLDLTTEDRLLESDARKALGDLAGGILGSSARASLLVVRGKLSSEGRFA